MRVHPREVLAARLLPLSRREISRGFNKLITQVPLAHTAFDADGRPYWHHQPWIKQSSSFNKWAIDKFVETCGLHDESAWLSANTGMVHEDYVKEMQLLVTSDAEFQAKVIALEDSEAITRVVPNPSVSAFNALNHSVTRMFFSYITYHNTEGERLPDSQQPNV